VLLQPELLVMGHIFPAVFELLPIYTKVNAITLHQKV
jgi:hypothetical protein